MVLSGKLFSAMKFLQEDPGCGSILNPSNVTDKATVRDILLQKHPDAVNINPDAIVTSPIAYPEIASFEAQLAFFELLKSFQQRWKHLQRCHNCSQSWFEQLMTKMLAFLQELGITCFDDGDPLLAILSMKIRNGGLGLDDPTTTTASEYSASLQVCATYAESQHCNNHDAIMTEACQLLREQRQLTDTERRSSALSRASQNL
ncbi:hypothetical protein GJ496_011902 [Pomphorhynchus laevis]|nr:hypothetical protein GJ496_011902 [Pomphorhynchus laevis]